MEPAALISRIDLRIVQAATLDALLTHTVPDSLISFEYATRRGLPDPVTYDPRTRNRLDPDFIEFGRQRAVELILDKIQVLAAVVGDDQLLTVFRTMTVPESWFDAEPDPRRLGLCWSWSEDLAIPYHGEGAGCEVRLRSRVHVDAVGWNTTLALGAGENYVTGEEREIRLRPGISVDLDRIERRNGPHEAFACFECFQPPNVWR